MDKNLARQLLQSHLQPGERLLWYGVPSPREAAAGHLFVLCFLTLWSGFAYLWTVGVAGVAFRNPRNDPWYFFIPFGIIGGVFCLIGTLLWLSTFKAYEDCWRTAYGLTERRALIAAEGGEVKSFTASAFSSLSRKGSGDKGTILFDYGPVSRKRSGFRAGFYGIEQPAQVEALIYSTLIKPLGEGPPL